MQIDGYVPLVSHDSDSLTWCIQHARIMPKWQNIGKVIKTKWVIAVAAVLFYFVVIAAYVSVKWEKNLIWDSYQIMLMGLQMIMNLSTSVNFTGSAHRIMCIIAYNSATLIYITFVSFYMLIITANIYYAQINTKYDLIHQKFRLTTDSYTMELLRQNQMVCKQYLLRN